MTRIRDLTLPPGTGAVKLIDEVSGFALTVSKKLYKPDLTNQGGKVFWREIELCDHVEYGPGSSSVILVLYQPYSEQVWPHDEVQLWNVNLCRRRNMELRFNNELPPRRTTWKVTHDLIRVRA